MNDTFRETPTYIHEPTPGSREAFYASLLCLPADVRDDIFQGWPGEPKEISFGNYQEAAFRDLFAKGDRPPTL